MPRPTLPWGPAIWFVGTKNAYYCKSINKRSGVAYFVRADFGEKKRGGRLKKGRGRLFFIGGGRLLFWGVAYYRKVKYGGWLRIG